jgi:hypothetical protein
MIIEPSRKGFFPFLWPDLRFDVRRHCTPGSENEFVHVETFSDDVAEVQKEVTTPVATAAAEVADPQPSGPQDEASSKFTMELEMTVHRGENPVQDVSLVGHVKIFLKARIPLPLLLPSIKALVRHIVVNC